MKETLCEFVDSRGIAVGVDRRQGVIRGVKILGAESRNGRLYLPDALSQAVRLYEGAKVNVNHAKGDPAAPRDYQDRIGVLRSVAVRPAEGLFADFHFNPKHALAEQLLWDAEHAPQNVGFSHNVQARTSRRGDRVVVEAITKVHSVDLVADPATTRGLFEAAGASSSDPPPSEAAAAAGQSPPAALADLTVAQLAEHRPDLVEAIRLQQASELARLREEVQRFEAARAQEEKRRLVRRLLGEYRLPDPETADGRASPIVGPRFLESLLSADEAAIREMLAERARLVEALAAKEGGRGPSRPLSRDQHEVYAPSAPDVKGFVASIT